MEPLEYRLVLDEIEQNEMELLFGVIRDMQGKLDSQDEAIKIIKQESVKREEESLGKEKIMLDKLSELENEIVKMKEEKTESKQAMIGLWESKSMLQEFRLWDAVLFAPPTGMAMIGDQKYVVVLQDGTYCIHVSSYTKSKKRSTPSLTQIHVNDSISTVTRTPGLTHANGPYSVSACTNVCHIFHVCNLKRNDRISVYDNEMVDYKKCGGRFMIQKLD